MPTGARRWSSSDPTADRSRSSGEGRRRPRRHRGDRSRPARPVAGRRRGRPGRRLRWPHSHELSGWLDGRDAVTARRGRRPPRRARRWPGVSSAAQRRSAAIARARRCGHSCRAADRATPALRADRLAASAARCWWRGRHAERRGGAGPRRSAPSATGPPSSRRPTGAEAPPAATDAGRRTGAGPTSAPRVPGRVDVGRGDSFWSIAEDVSPTPSGRPPSDAEVEPVLAGARSTPTATASSSPGNPDLIHPARSSCCRRSARSRTPPRWRAAGPARSSTARSPSHLDEAVELVDRQRGGRHAVAACAARAAGARSGAVSASSSSPPPRPTARRRRRRCSARACARSTTAGPPGASGRRSRSPGSRPATSTGGCGGTRGRGGPSSRSRTTPSPAAPSSSRRRARYLSAWSSSSGWRAGSAASGVPGLDGEGVGRLTCGGLEGERLVERALASRRATRRPRRR